MGHRTMPCLLQTIVMLILFTALGAGAQPQVVITDFGAVAGGDTLNTQAIQRAMDSLGPEGGIVRIPQGVFRSGGLKLRSHVTLRLEKGAVLLGSTNPLDYGTGDWNDAFLSGENLEGVGIEGAGLIDGVLCSNPQGEGGFRGPHTIRLSGCRGIAIRGISIARSGNYAILCHNCKQAAIENVSIRDPQDGLHAQACAGFTVRGCDLRTQDDAFAGCDNTDFEVRECRINSSCNGFRLGCLNLRVEDCVFQGPGEYPHGFRGQATRTNMLSAFVHFAPTDRNPKLASDNWLIRNCTVSNVDFLYGYDFERGLWQTGQPAKRIRFENVVATGLQSPIRVMGDVDRQFALSLEKVSLTFAPGRENQPALDLRRFGSLSLRNTTVANDGKVPVIRCEEGRVVVLGDGNHGLHGAEPVVLNRVDAVTNADSGTASPAPTERWNARLVAGPGPFSLAAPRGGVSVRVPDATGRMELQFSERAATPRALVPLAGETAVAWPEGAAREPQVYGFGADANYRSFDGGSRGGTTDLDAAFSVSWKDDALRLVVRVTDDVHHQTEAGGGIWTGDSIQIALQPYPSDGSAPVGFTEYAFAEGPTGVVAWRHVAPPGTATGPADPSWCEITREAATTTYRVRLSAAAVNATRVQPGVPWGCALLVNDNDGNDRKGCLHWGDGISGDKDPSQYNWLLPLR